MRQEEGIRIPRVYAFYSFEFKNKNLVLNSSDRQNLSDLEEKYLKQTLIRKGL